MPTTLNTLTGIVDFQPDHVLNHVILGQYLKEVPEGTKSLEPGMFKPGTVEEFEELHPKKSKAAYKDEADKTETDKDKA
jgi:hypothetical protein